MKNILLSLICLVLWSCQNEQLKQDFSLGQDRIPDTFLIYEELEIEPPRSAEPPLPAEFSLERGSKIIRNGLIRFEVSDIVMSKSEVDTLICFHHAYLENEHFSTSGNRRTYELTIRVPNEEFDALVAALEHGVGKLQDKNIRAEDVTEEYVDLKIRLENNLAYLTRYKALLNSANSVKEILEIQEKIRQIEEEVESKKGRLRFLDDQVRYSTLRLELLERIPSDNLSEPTYWQRVALAFRKGVHSLLDFSIVLVNSWPIVLLLSLLFLARKPIVRWFLRKKSTS